MIRRKKWRKDFLDCHSGRALDHSVHVHRPALWCSVHEGVLNWGQKTSSSSDIYLRTKTWAVSMATPFTCTLWLASTKVCQIKKLQESSAAPLPKSPRNEEFYRHRSWRRLKVWRMSVSMETRKHCEDLVWPWWPLQSYYGLEFEHLWAELGLCGPGLQSRSDAASFLWRSEFQNKTFVI